MGTTIVLYGVVGLTYSKRVLRVVFVYPWNSSRRTAKSNRLEDQVFWYKADIHPQFHMGANDWVLSQQNEAARAASGMAMKIYKDRDV